MDDLRDVPGTNYPNANDGLDRHGVNVVVVFVELGCTTHAERWGVDQ